MRAFFMEIMEVKLGSRFKQQHSCTVHRAKLKQFFSWGQQNNMIKFKIKEIIKSMHSLKKKNV